MVISSNECQDIDISEDDHSEQYEDVTSSDATFTDDFEDEEREQDHDESEVEDESSDEELDDADDADDSSDELDDTDHVYERIYDIRSFVEDQDRRSSSLLNGLHDPYLEARAWSMVQSKFIDDQRRDQDSPPCDIVTQLVTLHPSNDAVEFDFDYRELFHERKFQGVNSLLGLPVESCDSHRNEHRESASEGPQPHSLSYFGYIQNYYDAIVLSAACEVGYIKMLPLSSHQNLDTGLHAGSILISHWPKYINGKVLPTPTGDWELKATRQPIGPVEGDSYCRVYQYRLERCLLMSQWFISGPKNKCLYITNVFRASDVCRASGKLYARPVFLQGVARLLKKAELRERVRDAHYHSLMHRVHRRTVHLQPLVQEKHFIGRIRFVYPANSPVRSYLPDTERHIECRHESLKEYSLMDLEKSSEMCYGPVISIGHASSIFNYFLGSKTDTVQLMPGKKPREIRIGSVFGRITDRNNVKMDWFEDKIAWDDSETMWKTVERNEVANIGMIIAEYRTSRSHDLVKRKFDLFRDADGSQDAHIMCIISYSCERCMG